ncbi:MAG: DUF2279 domain-containing protein [Chitinophagaceae bacterium]|nr:MAG: DUF2279 domain-containing protein [Chitinophagaceae bacterium]
MNRPGFSYCSTLFHGLAWFPKLLSQTGCAVVMVLSMQFPLKAQHSPQVKPADLEKHSSVNIADALAGRIPSFNSVTQNDSTVCPTQHWKEDSTTLPPETVKRRTKIVAATNIIGYSAGMIGLYHAWYKDYPQSSFHTYNDIKEWKQMDKLGHMYSAYAESKASMEFWRWSGIGRKKRIWLGGMSGAAYQTVIEVLDGFSAEWGWSWGDFAANIAGSGMLVAQELAWDEQRIQMKWSFHRKRYSDATLNARSNKLFGKSSAERFLKDYNAQTYWLSVAPKALFPKSNLPAWLQVAVGTGVEGLFGGYENVGKDDAGNINFYRPDIARRRQWYLAPDVDLTKIKTNKKAVKVALQVLNIFKFPTPSLEFSRGKFGWNWLHF